MYYFNNTEFCICITNSSSPHQDMYCRYIICNNFRCWAALRCSVTRPWRRRLSAPCQQPARRMQRSWGPPWNCVFSWLSPPWCIPPLGGATGAEVMGPRHFVAMGRRFERLSYLLEMNPLEMKDTTLDDYLLGIACATLFLCVIHLPP